MADRGKEFDIDEGMELKFESSGARESRVVAKVIEGSCEFFGSVLEKGRVVKFPAGTKGAISAPNGPCKVQLLNQEKTSMEFWSGKMYQEFLEKMNTMRNDAKKNSTAGPRILICGPTDTGKSTLCKLIINSAVKAGHAVSFTDCDLGQNSITAPGSIASVFVEGEQIDVEDGVTLLPPLSFFFGDLTVTSSTLGKYHHYCCQTGSCLKANNDNRKQFQAGGGVVNTMGWVRDNGYQALKLIIESMDINVIVVMNDPKLQEMLQGECSSKIDYYDFQRQNTVATRGQSYRKAQRGERIVDYFRGCHTVLHPVHAVVPFSDIQLFTIGLDSSHASQSQTSIPDYLKLTLCAPDVSQTLCVCAVSHANTREEIPHANVAGYVVILSVDVENSCFTLLMPSGSHPPKRNLILSKIYVSYEEIM